jgi:hypothetical protein
MDANSRLAMLARARAKERGITYSEALRSLGQDNPALAQLSRQAVLSERSAHCGEPPSETLRRYAHRYSEEKGVSFSEALKAVGGANPYLVEQGRRQLLSEEQI